MTVDRSVDRIYEPGARLGRYEVVAHLATGGFSAVYAAKPLGSGGPEGAARRVALKVCRRDPRALGPAEWAGYNERLSRELELLAPLKHRNLVRVVERQCHEGLVFYAMELLEGPTLEQWLAAERRSYREVLRVFGQLGDGLAAAHRRGVLHRDVDPANVLLASPEPGRAADRPVLQSPEPLRAFLDEGAVRPVLIGFGLAQGLGWPPVILPGSLAVNPELAPPEYAWRRLAQRLDGLYMAAAGEDVYQLGVLLYRMLTGQRPTRTPPERLVELLAEIREVVPRHPLELSPEAPPAFSALAMDCLRKDPKERPRDAADVLRRAGEALQQDAALLDRQAPPFAARRAPAAAPERDWSRDLMPVDAMRAASEPRVPKRIAGPDEPLRRAVKELRRARRDVRGAGQSMRWARALVFVACGIAALVMGMGVGVGFEHRLVEVERLAMRLFAPASGRSATASPEPRGVP